MRHIGPRRMLCVAATLLGGAVLPATAAADRVGTYRVENVRTAKDRAAVARTGVAIVGTDHGALVVTASASDARRLRALRRYRVLKGSQARLPARAKGLQARAADFPGADAAYHNYAEMSAETAAIAAAYPSIVSRQSIGTSHEGTRQIWALKISDNVATDEAEPEVLFTHNHTRASTSPSRWRCTCSTS